LVPPAGQITQLLNRTQAGDNRAIDALLPLVYDELRRLADAYLRHERADHTLQTTALVHEAYMKLVGGAESSGPAAGDPIPWKNRAHFMGVAARAMRQILVNHARDRGRLKRGGLGGMGGGKGRVRVDLTEAAAITPEPDLDLVALDHALASLTLLDERKARTVEMRFFGGMTVEETAEALGVGTATVKRDWTMARAWLLRELGGPADPPSPSPASPSLQ
jgi:RNA polymerase sigma-70 factor (ECF subfamily)